MFTFAACSTSTAKVILLGTCNCILSHQLKHNNVLTLLTTHECNMFRVIIKWRRTQLFGYGCTHATICNKATRNVPIHNIIIILPRVTQQCIFIFFLLHPQHNFLKLTYMCFYIKHWWKRKKRYKQSQICSFRRQILGI